MDIATRLVAQKLSERLGQTFVVENRAGGAGNAAAEAVYRAAPDGYTLLASFNSTVSISDYLFKGLSYDPLGFEPVSVLTQIPLALVVRPDFPAADAKKFIAYAIQANPGKLTYASNGVGTAGHLTAAFFMALTGTKMTHVPYKGTAPVLTDLMAGNVDLTFIQYSAFYELHKAGRVRILATASEKRLDTLPDIPTMGELGLPEICISKTWNVIQRAPEDAAGRARQAQQADRRDPQVPGRAGALCRDPCHHGRRLARLRQEVRPGGSGALEQGDRGRGHPARIADAAAAFGPFGGAKSDLRFRRGASRAALRRFHRSQGRPATACMTLSVVSHSPAFM